MRQCVIHTVWILTGSLFCTHEHSDWFSIHIKIFQFELFHVFYLQLLHKRWEMTCLFVPSWISTDSCCNPNYTRWSSCQGPWWLSSPWFRRTESWGCRRKGGPQTLPAYCPIMDSKFSRCTLQGWGFIIRKIFVTFRCLYKAVIRRKTIVYGF